MRFYAQRHRYYVGVDLHARSMYVCVLDNAGKVLEHRKLPTERQAFLDLLRPYRKDPACKGRRTAARRRLSPNGCLAQATVPRQDETKSDEASFGYEPRKRRPEAEAARRTTAY